MKKLPKTYFTGYRMMVITINHKILNLKFFTDLAFQPKLAKFQNNSKNNTFSGGWAPPGSTIFLSEILILVSSIPYLCMAKKAKWFFDGKTFNFSK